MQGTRCEWLWVRHDAVVGVREVRMRGGSPSPCVVPRRDPIFRRGAVGWQNAGKGRGPRRLVVNVHLTEGRRYDSGQLERER